ncbi:hypothetical protein SBDP1_1410013 [Syntrophobacter sp. SbD1]|nr:hypothetical protein SBDP1_1410013 [Syntrophobacter sp. SbD1]
MPQVPKWIEPVHPKRREKQKWVSVKAFLCALCVWVMPGSGLNLVDKREAVV